MAELIDSVVVGRSAFGGGIEATLIRPVLKLEIWVWRGHRRHHQIPAHKRERGSVAGLHSSRSNKYEHEKRKIARVARLDDAGAALAYDEGALGSGTERGEVMAMDEKTPEGKNDTTSTRSEEGGHVVSVFETGVFDTDEEIKKKSEQTRRLPRELPKK